MAFAGLSVDVGYWYARAMQLQRGADASALAGVAWLPNMTTATNNAQIVASKNGFTDGSNNITVAVAPVSGNSAELRVTITDGNVPRFFTKLFLNNESITRTAVAQYLQPLPLGSPKNTFGTGDIFTGTNKDNMWGAVNGYCAGRESGDLLLARYDETDFNNQYNCPGKTSNSNYDANGYYYTVDVPSAASGTLHVWLFDPAFDGGRGDATLQSGAEVTTTYKFYAPGPNLTEVPTGGALLRSTTYASGDTTYKNQWVNFYSGTLTPGRYFLQVYTAANEPNSYGSNGFSIQAIIGSSTPGSGAIGSGTNACTNIVGMSGYSSTCPEVHGVDNMSVFNNLSSSTADFYLAEVDPVYAGKQLTVDLFDAAEGANTIQVLDPNGNIASFSWSTDCSSVPAPAGGCSGGPTTALTVSGSGTQPYPYLASSGRYNDRTIALTIQLPSNYTSAYGSHVWWKIRYTASSAPTDRTTWSASINGNPDHLVEG